ncbi:MAG: S41 family peptidase [Cytophagales bacterium]|nr:S41 family peptidase [Bernardetiaceae bacterium]MDW8205811.1 S41 family peptidase [Cytophagales bacterium]
MKRVNLWLTGLLILFTVACRNQKQEPITDVNALPIRQYVYEVMKFFYLWHDRIPTNINPNNFSTPEALLEAMLFRPTDRWSYIVRDNGATAAQLQTGSTQGFGFVWGLDREQNLRLVLVHPNSPAEDARLVRGMRVLSVNGTVINQGATNIPRFDNTVVLSVQDASGAIRQVELQARNFNMRGVTLREVKQVAGRKVGYLVFSIFTQSSVQELDEAFSFFRSENVNELVLDLRYNGGGTPEAALHLASLIAPNAAGRRFLQYQHNSRNTQRNTELVFKTVTNGLNLNRVFILTTSNTASASELIINGLHPFINVQTIGTTTHGKFVGGYVFTHREGYSLVPICFQSVNANGDTFANGFEPSFRATDDRTRPFGDLNENLLAAALHFIANGSFSGYVQTARLEDDRIDEQLLYAEDNAIRRLPIIGKLE